MFCLGAFAFGGGAQTGFTRKYHVDGQQKQQDTTGYAKGTEADPHGIQREVDRILVPDGHIIVLGFNPWSFWGVRRWFMSLRRGIPWCCHFISPTRMKDWLSLLGFDSRKVLTFNFTLPVQSSLVRRGFSLFERLGNKLWPSFGGAYCFVARKCEIPLTPLRARWQLSKPILKPGLVETMERRRTQERSKQP